MLLPRGVTGFDSPEAGIIVPSLREFRADCWQVALALGAKAENREQELCTSFVSQTIVWPDYSLIVLLNTSHPILALCKPFEPGTIAFEFTDNEKVMERFSEFQRYDVWRQKNLSKLFVNKMGKQLGPTENEKLNYFRKGIAKRIGDVIFNHWD
jgi:hypothetical protein